MRGAQHSSGVGAAAAACLLLTTLCTHTCGAQGAALGDARNHAGGAAQVNATASGVRTDAGSDAQAELLLAVLALPCGTQTVADVAGQTLAGPDALETFVRNTAQVQHGATLAGAASAQAELPLDALRQFLTREFGLESAKLPNEPSRLRARGAALSSVDVAASLGLGAAAPQTPENWTRVGRAAQQLALEAARQDARRRIALRLTRLRINAGTRVADLMTSQEELIESLSGMLIGASGDGTLLLRPDVLMAQVRLAAPADQALAALRRVHARCAQPPMSAADFERWLTSAITRPVDAIGLGSPPAAFVRRGAERVALELPDWAGQQIEAGADSPEQTGAWSAAEQRAAAQQAEALARAALRSQLAALPLVGQRSLGQLLQPESAFACQLNALLGDAAVVSTRLSERSAQVSVSLSGLRVWRIVQEELAGEAKN